MGIVKVTPRQFALKKKLLKIAKMNLMLYLRIILGSSFLGLLVPVLCTTNVFFAKNSLLVFPATMLVGSVTIILYKTVLIMMKLFLPLLILALCTYCSQYGDLLHQLGAKKTFLHGFLNETVYCQQPLNFENPSSPNHVCLLQKSLHGVKQAPRAWFHCFSSFIQTIGFTSYLSDTSLFVYHKDSYDAYLPIYVDNIVLTASSQNFLIISALCFAVLYDRPRFTSPFSRYLYRS
jgi:hypothetical protein